MTVNYSPEARGLFETEFLEDYYLMVIAFVETYNSVVENLRNPDSESIQENSMFTMKFAAAV